MLNKILFNQLSDINSSHAVTYQKWTTEDEAALEALEKKEMRLADTALGRLKETRKREFNAAFDAMTPEDQEEYLENLSKRKKSPTEDSNQ